MHENLICDEHFKKADVNAPIIHTATKQHAVESKDRNHKILEKAYKATKDPRYIHYLGISYFVQEDYQKALDTLTEYISVGGWDEEVYRSLLKMSDAAYMLGRYEDALQYALQALGLMPDYPTAMYALANLEMQKNNYKQALEWIKTAARKPMPKTSSIYDPTMVDKGVMMGAVCEFELGNHREAADLLKQVKTMDVDPELQKEVEYEASIDRLQAILPALFKHYEDPKVLWDGLKEDIKWDGRFRKYREQFNEPKKWAKKSVVFFCGKGYEEWGAHTLDKGMGGSEEAIVYLSRELSKLGYDVTVYGEVPKPYKDGEVKWVPWQRCDVRDTFDTLVVWRYPQVAKQFKARRIIVDMHDLLPQQHVKPMKDTVYMFKGQYHADQYPQITNYNVVSNGVVLDQFKNPPKKYSKNVIYPSAYYRGLETLVDNWAEIRKRS